MPIKKCEQYRAIHKRVLTREWGNLDHRSRDIIASDTEQETAIFKSFVAYVEAETERLLNDPEYFLNEPTRFKYNYHEMPQAWASAY